MKILFVILTCEKYEKTRVKWQAATWRHDVVHFIYLNRAPPPNDETYQNLSKKYLVFLKNYDQTDQYDWFFFCDDDTFCFTQRLNQFASLCDSNSCLMAGYELPEHLVKKATDIKVRACSGGAGILVSAKLLKNIQAYLNSTNDVTVLNEQADVSLAIWAQASSPDLIVVDAQYFFRPESPRHPTNKNWHHCITYHYCNQEDFHYLNHLRKINL